MSQTPTTTSGAAAEVLWVRGNDGCRPGAFHRHLIEAVTVASTANRELIRRGFPAYVAAVELAEQGPEGIAALERVAATPALAPAPWSGWRVWRRTGGARSRRHR